MKSIVSRLQKDIQKLQKTIHKESTDFLTRVRKLDIKDNLDATKKELETIISNKLKKLEPVYDSFITEIHKSAKKAGIDLSSIEEMIKSRAFATSKTIKKTRDSLKQMKKPNERSRPASASKAAPKASAQNSKTSKPAGTTKTTTKAAKPGESTAPKRSRAPKKKT